MPRATRATVANMCFGKSVFHILGIQSFNETSMGIGTGKVLLKTSEAPHAYVSPVELSVRAIGDLEVHPHC